MDKSYSQKDKAQAQLKKVWLSERTKLLDWLGNNDKEWRRFMLLDFIEGMLHASDELPDRDEAPLSPLSVKRFLYYKARTSKEDKDLYHELMIMLGKAISETERKEH